MAESHGFIRIMPDSTGKRIPQTVMMELTYASGTIAINRGDIITGVTSGIQGMVLEVVGNTTTGDLHISLRDDLTAGVTRPIPNNPQFVINENLQINSATVAIAANTGFAFYFQQMSLAGGKDSNNLLEIDEKGAAYTRYAEGAPIFDSFGKMLVAQQKVIAEYLHTYEIETDKVSVNVSGSGAVAHIPNNAGLLLSVGTDSGASAEVVSHQYHPYRLGQSRLVQFTTALGDSGKANLGRVWGYGDDSDGCFFHQENGVWGVMIRSSVTGVAATTMVPRNEWNTDRLDGSGNLFNPSGRSFDVTKDNITFLDLQWLGAGRVRFGVMIDGQRVLCHSIDHFNVNAAPYMRTGSLPIYYELKNTGVTASSSETRVWCTAVITGGDWEIDGKDFSSNACVKSPSTVTPIPVVSCRSKQTLNSITNRKTSFIKQLVVNTTAAPVIIEVWKNPTLTTAIWADTGNAHSCLEYDIDAATVDLTNARRLYSTIVKDTTHVDLSDIFNQLDEGIRRHFNPALFDTYTVTARRVAGTGATDVTVIVNSEDT